MSLIFTSNKTLPQKLAGKHFLRGKLIIIHSEVLTLTPLKTRWQECHSITALDKFESKCQTPCIWEGLFEICDTMNFICAWFSLDMHLDEYEMNLRWNWVIRRIYEEIGKRWVVDRRSPVSSHELELEFEVRQEVRKYSFNYWIHFKWNEIDLLSLRRDILSNLNIINNNRSHTDV